MTEEELRQFYNRYCQRVDAFNVMSDNSREYNKPRLRVKMTYENYKKVALKIEAKNEGLPK